MLSETVISVISSTSYEYRDKVCSVLNQLDVRNSVNRYTAIYQSLSLREIGILSDYLYDTISDGDWTLYDLEEAVIRAYVFATGDINSIPPHLDRDKIVRWYSV